MHRIDIFNKTYMVPSSFTEISTKQALAVLPYIISPPQHPEELAKAQAQVLYRLLPIYNYQWRKLATPANAGALNSMLQLTNFLFETPGTKPLFTEFRFNGVQYLLPSDKLSNCSLIEYAFADKALTGILALDNSPKNEAKKLEAITRIVAILCRPMRTDVDLQSPEYEGDPREKFSTPLVEHRVQIFKKLPLHIKQAVFLYFVAGRKWLHENFKVLFDNREPNEPETKNIPFGKTKLNAPDFGWMGVIFQLAESGVFGPFDQVKHFFLHTACYHMAQKAYAYYAQLDANK